MKKTVVLLLCFVMVFSMHLPVLAADAAWEDDAASAIGELDGEQIVVYGSAIPPEATQEASSMPSWIMLVLVILGGLLLSGAFVAVIVFLVILLIVKATRKKKAGASKTENDIPEAQE